VRLMGLNSNVESCLFGQRIESCLFAAELQNTHIPAKYANEILNLGMHDINKYIKPVKLAVYHYLSLTESTSGYCLHAVFKY
jgi:hypothetical protein